MKLFVLTATGELSENRRACHDMSQARTGDAHLRPCLIDRRYRDQHQQAGSIKRRASS